MIYTSHTRQLQNLNQNPALTRAGPPSHGISQGFHRPGTNGLSRYMSHSMQFLMTSLRVSPKPLSAWQLLTSQQVPVICKLLGGGVQGHWGSCILTIPHFFSGKQMDKDLGKGPLDGCASPLLQGRGAWAGHHTHQPTAPSRNLARAPHLSLFDPPLISLIPSCDSKHLHLLYRHLQL